MQPSPLVQAVQQADQLINSGRFDALMDFYTDDAVLVVRPGLNVQGRDGIRRAFDAIAAHFQHSLWVSQRDLQVVETGDTALVMGRARIQWRSSDGFLSFLERKATYVFRRQADDSWRCAVDNSYGTDLLDAVTGEAVA